jgi:hypothetical protein
MKMDVKIWNICIEKLENVGFLIIGHRNIKCKHSIVKTSSVTFYDLILLYFNYKSYQVIFNVCFTWKARQTFNKIHAKMFLVNFLKILIACCTWMVS